ncbi:MAG: MmgE/PrpD family protein [Bacillota bacterium]|nr:MmgE/PrpD family protein [Bacillota bacterium]
MTGPSISPEMERLSDYIAGVLGRDLPEEVAEKGKHHILDTMAAMVSGSRLMPGRKALTYVAGLGGAPEAAVVGTGQLTSAANAALANGMLGHADESDDSHAPSVTHPGCSIVPAALAMAERHGRSGRDLLQAVVLGYDVGSRVNLALGPGNLSAALRSSHAVGGLFGSTGAATVLASLDAGKVRYALSYAVQQASGVTCWVRDEEHILKAYVFGGMPAHNAVLGVTMVAAGCTGIDDVFSGERNFLEAFSPEPRANELVRGLGKDFEVMRTNIKKWPVGSPIQAAIDSLVEVMRANDLHPEDVDRLVVRLPLEGARTVDNRHMPDICLQHVMALILTDGKLTFLSVQDYARMSDPAVRAWRSRVDLVGDEELSKARPTRQAIVEVITPAGRRFAHRTYAVRGTADNPMNRAEVEVKALDLIAPVLGTTRARHLADAVWELEQISDVRELRPLLKA